MALVKIVKADPMKHKSGKPRLGPLNLTQLTTLLESSSKPKVKAKIRNRIAVVSARQPVVAAVVAE